MKQIVKIEFRALYCLQAQRSQEARASQMDLAYPRG